MIQGRYMTEKDDLSQLFQLRKTVFKEELGLPPELDQDGQDSWGIHAVAYQGEALAATGRILFDGEDYRISHVATVKDYRKQGYGDFIVRMLINKALLANASQIYADTLPEGRGLLEAIGFETCGETYEKGGHTWLPMYLKTENLHKCCQNQK